MKPHKKIQLLLATFLVAIVLFLVYRYETRKIRIPIALLINLTGPGGKAGRYIRDGAIFAAEHLRPDNCPIQPQLLLADYDESDQKLKETISRLYREGVHIFLGPVTSHASVVAVNYSHQKNLNVVFITPYAATSKLTGKKDNFIRTSVDNIRFSKAFIKWAKKNGLHKVAVVADTINCEFSIDIYKNINRLLGKNLPLVAFNSKEKFNPTLIATHLLSSKPDVILIVAKSRETAIICQKLRSMGYRGRFVATIWAQTPELIKWGA